jgi:hypothetical protein
MPNPHSGVPKLENNPFWRHYAESQKLSSGATRKLPPKSAAKEQKSVSWTNVSQQKKATSWDQKATESSLKTMASLPTSQNLKSAIGKSTFFTKKDLIPNDIPNHSIPREERLAVSTTKSITAAKMPTVEDFLKDFGTNPSNSMRRPLPFKEADENVRTNVTTSTTLIQKTSSSKPKQQKEVKQKPSDANIQLSSEQEHVLNLIMGTNANVFFTGNAGILRH